MRHHPPKIKVTKLDAARRQFRTAVRLWFRNDDPVAIHTLVSAAHEIIHTLFRRAGHRGLMFDADYIKDEYRSDWAKLIKRNASFFKHAREDPDGETEFDPKTNIGLLMASMSGLSRLTDTRGVEECCLNFYLRVHRPNWFAKQLTKDGRPVNLFHLYGDIERDEFFELYEESWRQGKAPGQPPSAPVRRLPL
jgi:hypothetical protein